MMGPNAPYRCITAEMATIYPGPDRCVITAPQLCPITITDRAGWHSGRSKIAEYLKCRWWFMIVLKVCSGLCCLAVCLYPLTSPHLTSPLLARNVRYENCERGLSSVERSSWCGAQLGAWSTELATQWQLGQTWSFTLWSEPIRGL